MEKKAKVPKLRFPGFTGEWEERKLGEIAEFSKGNGYSKDDLVDFGTPIILYGRMYTKYQIQINDVDTFVNETKNSVYSTGLEVIVPASGETAEDIAIASAVMKPGIILGGDINIIYPVSRLNSVFLALQISGGKAKREMSKRAQGKSIVHLHNADLREVAISIPEVVEQEKISRFFYSIDKLIMLQQCKLAHLQAQKKCLLQKMFPKKGERFPELRFPGFTDDWEQKKLGELCDNTYGGGTPKTTVLDFWNGTIPWIQSSDLSEGNVLEVSPNKFVSDIGLQKSATKLVPANSIMIVTRVGVGKLALMPYEYTTSQDFLSLSDLNIDGLFGVYSLYRKLQQEKNMVQGTSIKGITKEELLNKCVDVPVQINEQKKIGIFLKNLDKLITLHERELAHLQTQKKALLQQMFV